MNSSQAKYLVGIVAHVRYVHGSQIADEFEIEVLLRLMSVCPTTDSQISKAIKNAEKKTGIKVP